MLSTTYFADINASQKRDNQIIGPFDREHAYYQTLTSAAPYLSRIELSLLSSGYPDNDDFQVILYLQDDRRKIIANTKYVVPRSAQEFDIKISFKPQVDSLNKKYYLLVRTNAPPDTVFLLGSEYDAFTRGELFVNGSLTNQDLVFFTYSKPPPTTLIEQTIKNSFLRFWDILFISVIVFCLGYITTSIFLTWENSLELIVYTIVCGVSIPPILLLLLSLLGFRLEKNYLIIILVGLLLISTPIRLIYTKKKTKIFNNIQSREIFFLGVLFLLAVFTRISQIKDLSVPSGIGAYTHQKILERIAHKEEIPLDSIYHLGFHSNVYFFHILTNRSIPEVTLLFSQWLSVFSGLSFYLLARKALKYPTYALISTSLYWFISPIPAYLMNISRYPFLQGMTILPCAIALFWDNEKFPISNKVVTIAILTGLLLSHYGLAIILAISLFGLFFYKSSIQISWQLTIDKFLKTGFFFIPLALVFTIKFYYIVGQGSWETFIRDGPIVITLEDYKYIFSHTLRHGGWIVWLLGILGSLMFFSRYPKLFPLVIICSLALFGLNWLQLGLVGHSSSRFTNILFFLSMPMSILAGYFLHFIIKNNNKMSYLTLLALSLCGSYNISGIINPRNSFFSSADQEALSWIENNISTESTILINSYPWDGKYEPTDGGGWISYLSGRKTIYPKTQSEYNEIEDFINQSNVNYIYLGVGYGELTPLNISRVGKTLLYEKNGIYIFGIDE